MHLLRDCRGPWLLLLVLVCCCFYSCCRNKKAISKPKTKRRRTNQSRLQFPVLLRRLLQVNSLAAASVATPWWTRERERHSLTDQTRPVDSQCERRPRARVREVATAQERESVHIQCRARRCGFYDLARHLLANSHCVRLKDTEIDTDTNTNTDTDTDTWTGCFENREAKRKKYVAVNGQQHVCYSVRRRLKVFYALRGWSQAKGQTVGHRQRTLKRAGRLFNNLALWNTQQEKSNNKIHMYT